MGYVVEVEELAALVATQEETVGDTSDGDHNQCSRRREGISHTGHQVRHHHTARRTSDCNLPGSAHGTRPRRGNLREGSCNFPVVVRATPAACGRGPPGRALALAHPPFSFDGRPGRCKCGITSKTTSTPSQRAHTTSTWARHRGWASWARTRRLRDVRGDSLASRFCCAVLSDTGRACPRPRVALSQYTS